MSNKFHSLTTDQLVQRFVEIGMSQDEALFRDKIGEFNRLYKQKVAIVTELKSRAGDERRALIQLYEYPNVQVRLNAATATLAVAPQQARQMLEAIEASKEFPQAGDAGMFLVNLDRGLFKPT